jgi:hypothetical protein
LREEHRLGAFENRVLREIFWSKREEVVKDWRKLRSEDFHDLYSPNIIGVIRQRRVGGVCGMYRGGEGACRILVGKSEVKSTWNT